MKKILLMKKAKIIMTVVMAKVIEEELVSVHQTLNEQIKFIFFKAI